MIVTPGADDKPIVAVTVNLDDIMVEAVGLIRSARSQFETVSDALGERLNVSLDTTVDDIVTIVGNVREITTNLAQTTGTFYQPFIYIVLMFILTLIFFIILLLIALRTRREYKKRPIKFFRRRFGKHTSGSVQADSRRQSPSAPTTESGTLEARSETKYRTKKGDDTLV
ncbi:hypothetical protein M3Y98_00439600 [Aphelenchoides besseyi]|nr:hypothetical protein M3Y98_00439600 [Aphelenchoides besseyi]KAI6202335.1 hypothetical protein M3Y96_00937400 [Aphelenchoides besseyi]